MRATTMRGADLDVERIGEGPPILFVHGDVVGAAVTWRKQRPLAERWRLILPNRPGSEIAHPWSETTSRSRRPSSPSCSAMVPTWSATPMAR